MERLVRLTTLLIHATEPTARASGYTRANGVGGFIRHLKKLSRSFRNPNSSALVSNVRQALYADGNVDIIGFRNFISHGGVLPTTSASVDAIATANKSIEKAIHHFISSSGSITRRDGQYFLGGSPLYPYIIPSGQTSDQTFLTFQDLGSQCHYASNSNANPLISFGESDDLYLEISRRMEPEPKGHDSHSLKEYKIHIEKDVEGFLESGSDFEIRGQYSPFSVRWERASSDGSEIREDYFRIGADHQRQWLAGEDDWTSYANFLKHISNWDVIVQRLDSRMKGLKPAIHQAAHGSRNILSVPDGVKQKYLVSEAIGQSMDNGDLPNLVDLTTQVDKSATNRPGVTQVYFVSGEAGIGKTHNLISMSADRTAYLRANCSGIESSTNPIYLYVSCSGAGLDSIEALVDHAVIKTHNLSWKSVLALCRNGLCVIILDGFDELVADAGYKDAFTLLEPALKGLGDSGTLLVSARSSYLANYYRSSIGRKTKRNPNPPDHLVISLERWSRPDIDRLFEANPTWGPYRDTLSSDDLDLIGVPFFAQTFHEISLQSKSPNVVDLREELIESYLRRELNKIDQANVRPLGVDDIKNIYVEIAGIMWRDETTQIDRRDFLFACEYALGLESGFSGRDKQLADRLTVLCGFKATERRGETDSQAFGFEHDLFQEIFLGINLARTHVTGQNPEVDPFLEDLSFAPLGQAALLQFSSTSRSMHDGSMDALVRLMRACLNAPRTYTFGDDESHPLLKNIAAIIADLASAGEVVMDPITDLRFTRFSALEIGSPMELKRCSFELLEINPSSDRNFSLDDCTIEMLHIPEPGAGGLSGLACADNLSINALTIGGGSDVQVAYGSQDCLLALHNKGARGLEEWYENYRASSPTPLEEFAIVVFEKFSSRGTSSFVVESRNRKPGSTASAWMPRPTDNRWSRIVAGLTNSGLATENPFDASGRRKSTIRFDVSPAEILHGRGTSGPVGDFWRQLGQ